MTAHALSLRPLCIVSLDCIEKLLSLYRSLLSGPVIDLRPTDFILTQVKEPLITSFVLLKNLATNHSGLIHHDLLSYLSLRRGLSKVMGGRLKGASTLGVLTLISLYLLEDIVTACLPLKLLKHEIVSRGDLVVLVVLNISHCLTIEG